MVARVTRLIGIGLVLTLAVMRAEPAFAEAVLLKRAALNVISAPVDLVMVPYTFPDSFVHGFYQSKRYSVLEKVLLTPAWAAIYVPCCGFVSTMLPAARFVEGVAMLPVGVATSGSDYDWRVFQALPGARNAVIQKPPPLYMGTRWCDGFFQ